MKPKIFISGKITGDPNYKAKFAAAEAFYKKKGYTVLNPAVLPGDMQPADYMRICFAMIDTADAVAFLPDYHRSPGAELELNYCCYIEKNIHHFEDDINPGPCAAAVAAEMVQPMAEPVININLGDPAEQIKKALEKDLYKGLYPNFLEGASK